MDRSDVAQGSVRQEHCLHETVPFYPPFYFSTHVLPTSTLTLSFLHSCLFPNNAPLTTFPHQSQFCYIPTQNWYF